MDVGTGYRPLEIGEVHVVGDEWFRDGEWHEIAPWFVGLTYYGVSYPFRRKVPVEDPSSYPPLSPEAKDSMEQDAKAMQDTASSVPAESPERKETGHTVDEVKEAQGPIERETRRIYRIADNISTSESDILQIARALDAYYSDTWEDARRILDGAKHTKETGYAGPDVPQNVLESDVPTYNAARTHVTIPISHPWVPKPFTPNKYTRNMPTLDGRTVPVDVYCVLAAFPTGSTAVDHAVKKELAPGQRGHKDRIQDLKEARDSLTRAIELEEAQNA